VAYVVVIRKRHRGADENRCHLRREFLVDLIDDTSARPLDGLRGRLRVTVGRYRDHDRVRDRLPLRVGHRHGDLGGLRARDADREDGYGIEHQRAHAFVLLQYRHANTTFALRLR
jgi:hypothetical protein